MRSSRTPIRSRRSKAYEAKRLPATSEVVLANRKAPPDAILHEVYRRTGDKPFKNIDDVISREELIALSESYKRVAGYDKERLKSRFEGAKKADDHEMLGRAYIRRHPLQLRGRSMMELEGSTSSLKYI